MRACRHETTREYRCGPHTDEPAEQGGDAAAVRLFQNARYYPSLRPRVRELTRSSSTFAGKIDAFLNFRYSAAHILQPIDQRAEWAFFTNGDDESVQRLWAREHGLCSRTSLTDILKAQIE